jgi:hypothetical protein
MASTTDGGKEWSAIGSAVARDHQDWAVHMGTLLIFGDSPDRYEVKRGRRDW